MTFGTILMFTNPKIFIMKKIITLLVVGVAAFGVTMVSTDGSKSTLMLADIEALANGETGYSCTVTSTCMNGSVSCTGTSCSRGTGWVECNGRKTNC